MASRALCDERICFCAALAGNFTARALDWLGSGERIATPGALVGLFLRHHLLVPTPRAWRRVRVGQEGRLRQIRVRGDGDRFRRHFLVWWKPDHQEVEDAADDHLNHPLVYCCL